MSCQPEKRARAGAILGELAELGLMLVRELAIQARACEEPAEQAVLVEAVNKTWRSVRLTLALDSKLDRDAARDAAAEAREAREIEAAAQDEARRNALGRREVSPVEARKTRVSNLLNRLLWTESEGDSEEFEILSDDLDARLDEAARAPEFLDQPIETLVRRMIADMGLTGRFTITLGEAPPAETQAPQRTPELADSG